MSRRYKLGKNCFVILFVGLLFSNCGPNKNVTSQQEIIFNQVLKESISYIVEPYNLSGQTIVSHNFYPDKAKETYLHLAKEDIPDSASWKKQLVERLMSVSEDSLDLNIDKIETPAYTFFKEGSQPDSVIFNDSFFGGINLTNVAISSDHESACFYIALQCGRDCGDGYLVFLNKTDGRWVVSEYLRIWTGLSEGRAIRN